MNNEILQWICIILLELDVAWIGYNLFYKGGNK